METRSSLTSERRRALTAGVLIGAICGSVVLVFDPMLSALTRGAVQPLYSIELKTYDWRLSRIARPETARADIVMVAIDEDSLRALQPQMGRWPWPRVVHAAVIDFLARAPARAVVYDINFAEPDSRVGFRVGDGLMSGAESDREFVAAVRRAGNVYLLADAAFETSTIGRPLPPSSLLAVTGDGLLERKAVFPPFPPLGDAAAGLGHSLVALDHDGPLRHTVPLIRTADHAVPSLSLAVALDVLKIDRKDVTLVGRSLVVGDRAVPLSYRPGRFDREVGFLWSLVNFHGGAVSEGHAPYRTYRFVDLLATEEQIQTGMEPAIDPAAFKDKIVFVGATASGLSDVFETSFSSGRMPGMQVHAAALDDLLSKRFIREIPPVPAALVVAVVSLAVGLLSAGAASWWAALGTVAILAVLGWLATLELETGNWVPLAQPGAAAVLALVAGMTERYFVVGRERRRIKRLFSRYVSRDVFNELLDNPELAQLGGKRRHMTVLFSDIRGFSGVSERIEPETLVPLLNEYFGRMVEIVLQHRGTLDKFVGDQVMALFGAPLDDELHAQHAVDAALDMIIELEVLNRRWSTLGLPVLDIGIGISTGAMIAGNIGSSDIMSYTVIGDAVNLGARLESLNKDFGTRIIVSEPTRQALSDSYAIRFLDNVVVRGKTTSTPIYEVTGYNPVSNEVPA